MANCASVTQSLDHALYLKLCHVNAYGIPNVSESRDRISLCLEQNNIEFILKLLREPNK